MFRAFAVAAGLFLATASSVQAQTWTIDSSHSAAQFAVRHMMVTTVRGDMGKIAGTVTFDPSKPAAATNPRNIRASTYKLSCRAPTRTILL